MSVRFVNVDDEIGERYTLLILSISAITKDFGFSSVILSTKPSSSAILKNCVHGSILSSFLF